MNLLTATVGFKALLNDTPLISRTSSMYYYFGKKPIGKGLKCDKCILKVLDFKLH